MESPADNFNYSIDNVIEELLDEDTTILPKNLTRLSDIGGEEITQFQKIWLSISDWRRQALLEELDQLYQVDTLLSFENILRIALDDPSPQIRFIALRCIQEYDVMDLVPDFIHIVEYDDDEELRALAASTLGKYIFLGELGKLSEDKLDRIERCLFGLLKAEETPLIRRHALESLGFSSSQDVVGHIKDAFESNKTYWVSSALIAMGRSFDSHWEKNVLSVFDHPSPDIRIEAIKAAGELELSNAKKILIDFLNDDDSEIRMAAILALSKIGGSGLAGIFQNILENTSDEDELEIIENAMEILAFNQSLGFPDLSPSEDKSDYDSNSQDMEI